jgi:hypothetical protein
VRVTLIVFVAALAVAADPGVASWQATGNGTGSAKSKSMSGPAAKPTATVSSHDVTVTWTASTFATGGAVPSYVVKRYDLLGNAQVVGAACSGLVSATSCTESGVATGTWKYSVTPAAGIWRGTEGPQSDPVVVTI